jgi:hypothetical protein
VRIGVWGKGAPGLQQRVLVISAIGTVVFGEVSQMPRSGNPGGETFCGHEAGMGGGSQHGICVCFTEPSVPRHKVAHTTSDLQVQGGLGVQPL